jgi:hypothetical protein
MRRPTLVPTCLLTLLSFGTLATAPRLARAQAIGDEPAPAIPQPLPPNAPPPPGYYAPPPPGYYAPPPQQQFAQPTFHMEERPRYGLMTAGLVTFGATWVTTTIWGYALGDYTSIIPIIGPLFYVHSTNSNDIDAAAQRLDNAFLVLDSLAQAAGAAMFIAGLVSKQQVRVWGPAQVSFVPVGSSQMAGLAAVGRF